MTYLSLLARIRYSRNFK